jgi:S-DNA-T family DNA segregation ATPase FtsK/SpoIIIE
MPHLLIAGATGSGKSVCINSIIASFLCTRTPDFLRMIMVDTKRVELTGYNGIPHLLAPVVMDLDRVAGTLQWVSREMEQRYRRFVDARVRNITDFRQQAIAGKLREMPYIVVLVDELADLMLITPEVVERSVSRIAREAHAAGIHLIVSTQRPSVDLVPGSIKASFPARISFGAASGVDSRVNIGTVGADRLWGPGAMLFRSPKVLQPTRVQGCFVSGPEQERLIGHWEGQAEEQETPATSGRSFVQVALPSLLESRGEEPELPPGENDELFGKAVEVVRKEGWVSTTLLQRRLRIGYARASRIIDALEERGIVGPDSGGSRGRVVL